MGFFIAANAFNSGELSPRMLSRPDVAQYSKGCRILKNFLVTPYGSVERRPGTACVHQCGENVERIRLIPFIVSKKVNYLLVFVDGKVLVYDPGSGQISFELDNPFKDVEDLRSIQFVQSVDVMTLVHPEVPVQELYRGRTSDGKVFFGFREKAFEYPPVLDPNIKDDFFITPSAVDGNITLTATEDIFSTGHTGGYFTLTHIRKENEVTKDFTADGVSSSLEVYGNWSFTTHGTWTGRVSLQRSFDNGVTWSDYKAYSVSGDSNVSDSGKEEADNVLFRISMTGYAASNTGTLKLCRAVLLNPDFAKTGVVRITGVDNARSAAGKVTKKLGGTEKTADWCEGAWSGVSGYPASVAFFEERMFFGGTPSRPQTLWGSKVGDWDNFLLDSKDDSALSFTLASDTVNDINWLCQHGSLIIGTGDSEWTLSASSRDEALTPANFRLKRQSVYGSAGIPGHMVGDTVLFVQSGRRKVREFVYAYEKEGYAVPDMTILAEHITQGKIIETALQRFPDSVYWCVLADGTLAAMTYERDQEVTGWHRHETRGKFVSVAVLPEVDRDRVYFAVERGGGVYVEAFAEDVWTDCTFITVSAVPVNSVDVPFCDGTEVYVVADGAPLNLKTVVQGKVMLDLPAREIKCGLPYESVLSPMPFEIQAESGLTLLRRKAVGEIRLRFYNSIGGEVKVNDDMWQPFVSRDVNVDLMDSPVLPKDGTAVFYVRSGYNYAPLIEVRAVLPVPFNIESLSVVYEVAE